MMRTAADARTKRKNPHSTRFGWYIYPPTLSLEKIASRTSLVKYIVHLWGYGTNDEELKTSVRKGKDEAWLDQSMTYKLTCCDFGATRSNEKSEVMRRLSNLVPGAFEPRSKVSLDQPRVEFLSMEVKSTVQIDLGFQGVRMFFGRVVGKDKSRKHLNLLDLKKRRYLGPTSMEAHMSLIMCNMIKAERERGGPVLDPFCGTGSVLLAAAELGCFTCGFEIDPRVLEFGKVDAKTGQKLDVITNFKDYGFNKPIFLIRGDVHKSPLLKVVEDEVESRCRISGSSDGGEKFAPLDLEKIEKRIKQMEGAFQGIVADPPYGIRERGRKSQFGGKRGKTEQDMINIGEPIRQSHPVHGELSAIRNYGRFNGSFRENVTGWWTHVLLPPRGCATNESGNGFPFSPVFTGRRALFAKFFAHLGETIGHVRKDRTV